MLRNIEYGDPNAVEVDNLAPITNNVPSDIITTNMGMDGGPSNPFQRSSKLQKTPYRNNDNLSEINADS